MAQRFTTGFETGDSQGYSAFPADFSVQSAIKRAGTYALKATGGTGLTAIYQNFLAQGTLRLYVEAYIYIDFVATTGSPITAFPFVFTAWDGTDPPILSLSQTVNTFTFTLTQQGGALSVASGAMTAGVWHKVGFQMKYTTPYLEELYIDDVLIGSFTPTVLTQGLRSFNHVSPNASGGFNYLIDTVAIDDQMYPSQRQGGFAFRPFAGTRPRPFAPGIAR